MLWLQPFYIGETESIVGAKFNGHKQQIRKPENRSADDDNLKYSLIINILQRMQQKEKK